MKNILLKIIRRLRRYKNNFNVKIAPIIFYKCKINNKKIIFDNFIGRGFGCNPKYIALELINRNKDYDLVWLVNDMKEELPKQIRKVKYGSLRSHYELATSKIRIDNVRNPLYLKKRDGQYLLQVWHGGLGFKKVEGEIEEKLTKDYVACAKKEGAICDAIISSSKIQSNLFKEHFWLGKNTEILEIGLPRNDILFDKKVALKNKRNICERLNISSDYGVILYMPTFRNSGITDGYNLQFEKIIEAFEKKFKKEFVLLVKLHPNAQKYSEKILCSKKMFNVTSYPDAQELYHIADYLITDYSSSAFDFLLLNKPVFLCMLDFEMYFGERGFRNTLEIAPFSIAKSNDELMRNIELFSYSDYMYNVEEFKLKWKPYDDGTASIKACDWIEKVTYNDRIY